MDRTEKARAAEAIATRTAEASVKAARSEAGDEGMKTFLDRRPDQTKLPEKPPFPG